MLTMNTNGKYVEFLVKKNKKKIRKMNDTEVKYASQNSKKAVHFFVISLLPRVITLLFSPLLPPQILHPTILELQFILVFRYMYI